MGSESRRFSRRSFVQGALALGAMGGLRMHASAGQRSPARPQVAVVGAGAFGGWTALALLRGGARVTLLDAWGPGNSRASSGGETRVIRAAYDQPVYVAMVRRALEMWRENQQRWRRRLYHQTSVLWMAGDDDAYERAALKLMREAEVAIEQLEPAELRRRWPQIDFNGVPWGMLEADGGFLMARQACAAVLEGFLGEGGEYRELAATPGEITGGRMRALRLSDGSPLEADYFVFACGPWLGELFPEVIGERVLPTKQDVFFFGTPPGDARYHTPQLPVWIDNGESVMYGIPGAEHRGFKIADDARGPRFDPTHGQRLPSPEALEKARAYVARRFPGLRDAPLLEARVCQYENSPDGNFIADRHPQAEDVLLLGGGSGHGFKFGPALGEMAANIVLQDAEPDPLFRLARLSKTASAVTHVDSRGRTYST
jgi:glycine/D-amino acid oxidase-like deaminating enzyme